MSEEIPQPSETTLSPSTKMTIGTLLAVLVGIVLFVVAETSFKVNTGRDVSDIKKEITEIKQILKEDTINKNDFEWWLVQFKRENPDIEVPDVRR